MNLNFKEFGQGDPVIILHGLFGTLDNWQTIAKKLAENYSVYIIDQRNHGRSPHVPGLSYPLMAEDLAEFMEQNWIYKAHIIGHSMGGKTALQFALNYGDMVDKLVIVDIGTQKNEAGHQQIFEALLGLDLNKIESRKDADFKLKTLVPDFGVRQFLLKNLTRTKEGQYQWKMNLEAINENYPNILEAVSGDEVFEGPSLFIKGGNSNYIDENEFSVIQKDFTNAKLISIPNTGHWVHAEAPKELLSEVESFLL